MKRWILFAVIGFCCLTNCKRHDNYNLEEVKKIIETRYYEPIKFGDEWVCGRELFDMHHEHTIVYYDSYDNEIIKKSINDKDETFAIIKRYYFAPEEQKLSKIEAEYPLTKESEAAYWIRNDNGRLIEVQGCVSSAGIRTMSCEYDEQGRRVKESWSNLVKHIKYNPENPSTSVFQYEIYDSKCNYSYHLKKGLVEFGVSFIDKGTGLVMREIKETYKYGCLDTKYDIEYVYNADRKLISELGNGAITATYYEVPRELSKKEQEEYIIRNYYSGTQASIKRNYVNSWVYNKYGDCVKKIESVNDNIMEEENRIYEYNEYGDWVKCLVFRPNSLLSGFFGSEEETPSEIVIRNITYF